MYVPVENLWVLKLGVGEFKEHYLLYMNSVFAASDRISHEIYRREHNLDLALIAV